MGNVQLTGKRACIKGLSESRPFQSMSGTAKRKSKPVSRSYQDIRGRFEAINRFFTNPTPDKNEGASLAKVMNDSQELDIFDGF